jgi:hypothetical protein
MDIELQKYLIALHLPVILLMIADLFQGFILEIGTGLHVFETHLIWVVWHAILLLLPVSHIRFINRPN